MDIGNLGIYMYCKTGIKHKKLGPWICTKLSKVCRIKGFNSISLSQGAMNKMINEYKISTQANLVDCVEYALFCWYYNNKSSDQFSSFWKNAWILSGILSDIYKGIRLTKSSVSMHTHCRILLKWIMKVYH